MHRFTVKWLVGATMVATVLGATMPLGAAADRAAPHIEGVGECSTVDVRVAATAVKAAPVSSRATASAASVDEERIVVGDTLIFTVRVANQGASAATGVSVNVALSAGLSFVGASTSNGSFNSSTLRWTVGTVAAQGEASLTVRALVTAPGSVSLTATLVGLNETDRESNDDQATVTRTAFAPGTDLSVTNSFTNAAPDLRGDGTTVNRIVVNSNDAGAAAGVKVRVVLPTGYGITDTSGGTFDVGTSTFDLGTVNGFDTVVLTISLSAQQEGILLEGATSVATVTTTTTETDLANNSATAGIDPPDADLSLEISAVAVATPLRGLSDLGPNFAITIVVTNLGSDTAVNVVVSATISGRLVVESTDPVGVYDASAGTVTWTLPSIATGPPVEFQIAGWLNDTSEASISATAASDTYDKSVPNNTDSISVSVFKLIPPSLVPQFDAPVDTIPAETVPTETVPTETVPTETVPAETVPVETVPVETVPAETLPVETVAPESFGQRSAAAAVSRNGFVTAAVAACVAVDPTTTTSSTTSTISAVSDPPALPTTTTTAPAVAAEGPVLTTTTSTTATTSPAVGALPVTGGDSSWSLVAGICALGAGIALTLAARRRRPATD